MQNTQQKRGHNKLFTANTNRHPKIKCEGVFVLALLSSLPLFFPLMLCLSSAWSLSLSPTPSLSLSLSPLSIFGVPAKFSMIFPFERDKKRDVREGRMDGGRFGERARARRDSGKWVMEWVERGGEGRRQVGSGNLGKERRESDGGRRLVQFNTWTVERGGLWFKNPSPKDQTGPHTHFHCYYKSFSLSLPLIQTSCLFLTPTCMYLLSRIGARIQTAIISFFHVTVLKQKQITTSSIYPPHLCSNFHELLGRTFMMKPNLGEMVGGETWATRSTDTVGGEWTLGELQLSSGFTLELDCLSRSLPNILLFLLLEVFKFSYFKIWFLLDNIFNVNSSHSTL